ncbi:MAG: endo-1,4-beta-xylanase [Candidatus Sulfotelmatobacter sp.]
MVCRVVRAQQQPARQSEESLRQYADPLHFWVGTTLQGRAWKNPTYMHLLGTQYNSGISIVMFPGTQPQPAGFDFDAMDREMRFAKEHNMKLFGVALVYRSGLGPDWFKESCRSWSQDKMDQLLKNRIETIVRHGGDMFYGWEVVNEPTNPSHNGCWSSVLGGEDYIAKAFRYAREANPNVQLLLNDTFGHDGVNKPKAQEFFDLVRRLKSKGVPIDVAGIEMHLQSGILRPSYIDEFKWYLAEAKSVGVQVQVTEMDVYLPAPGPTPEALRQQEDIYYNVLHTCLKDSNCTAFSTWGTADGIRYAHMAEVSEQRFHEEAPLLFDENFSPKPAFNGVLRALQEGR